MSVALLYIIIGVYYHWYPTNLSLAMDNLVSFILNSVKFYNGWLILNFTRNKSEELYSSYCH